MTEKDNSFNLKYATFSAKKFKWQVLTNFYMYIHNWDKKLLNSQLNIRLNLTTLQWFKNILWNPLLCMRF